MVPIGRLGLLARLLVTTGLCLWLALVVDWSHAFVLARQVSAKPVLAFLTFYAVFQVIGAVNLWVLAEAQHPRRVRFTRMLGYYLVSSSVGSLTPAQAGELSLAGFLHPYGFSLAQGAGLVILDKVITLAVFGLVALTACFLYAHAFALPAVWQAVIPIAAILGLALLVGGLVRRSRIPARPKCAGIPKTPAAMQAFLEYFPRMVRNHPLALILNLGLSAIRMFVAAWMTLFALRAFGYAENGFWDIFWLTSVARLTTYIPISVNGLGVMEGSAVVLLGIVGIPKEMVLNAFLFNRLVHYLFCFGTLNAFAARGKSRSADPED
jgi:uncharacterized protein (TIRG00374 family)